MPLLCVVTRIFRRLPKIALVAGLMISNQAALADPISDGQNALLRGDESGAVKLWTPPATQGDPEAQFRLGLMYLSGRGVAADKKIAVRWLKLALEKHHIGSSLVLADIYLDKAGSYYDPDTAIALLRNSAEQGATEAQRYLAQIYRKGGGVSQNFDEAFQWFKLAAAKGDIASQAGLGELYRYGYGVEQSYPKAFMWTSLAASALTNNAPDRIVAVQSAIKSRNELEHMMSAEELAGAEHLAITCWQSKLQNCD